MSVLKHYIVFGLLFWLAFSGRLGFLADGDKFLKTVIWLIVFLFLIAVGMTVYVIWQRKRKGRRNGGHSPLL